jgi:hypothetical protein
MSPPCSSMAVPSSAGTTATHSTSRREGLVRIRPGPGVPPPPGR